MHRGRPNDGLEAKITYHQRQGHLTAEVAEIAEETTNRVENKTILPLKQRHLTAAGAKEEESKGEGLQGAEEPRRGRARAIAEWELQHIPLPCPM